MVPPEQGGSALCHLINVVATPLWGVYILGAAHLDGAQRRGYSTCGFLRCLPVHSKEIRIADKETMRHVLAFATGT
jgi:hypothetical protein